MAEDGRWTAGEDRGHPASVERQLRVADRVDAAIHAVKLGSARTPVKRAGLDARELPARDDALLGGCPPCEPSVQLRPVSGANSHLTDRGANRVTGG
jgi:hypothetical protein